MTIMPDGNRYVVWINSTRVILTREELVTLKRLIGGVV